MAKESAGISVIIPSAREEMVAGTVNALLNQTDLPGDIEILVVCPATVVSLPCLDPRETRVKLVHTERLLPPGKMRNIGVAASRYAVLGFIDDDCVPPENWLSSLYSVLADDGTVGAVGCRVCFAGENTKGGRLADVVLFSAYQFTQSCQTALGSAAILVRREAFTAAGGFDEQLLASEDWDFSLRLQDNGWKCWFNAECEVSHYHGRDAIRSIMKNAFLSGKKSGLVVQKRHYEKLSWLAKLSVKMGSPLLYWMLILPYAVLITVLQVKQRQIVPGQRVMSVLSIFFGKVLYHIGVWRKQISLV